MINDAERDHRVMAVVASALQKPAELRRSFLQLAFQDDEALYHEAAETLEWEERMGNFLLEPLCVFKNLERPFQPGELVCERFEIVREIGEGGMGIVYEAYDRKRKQRIAIKSAKTGFRRLLTPELENALQVRHPNICLVNEIHTAQTAHGEIDFLTMEFLDGQSLSTALSLGAKFNQEDIMEIASQLCAGLAEAHRSGVIHRDLKGANVILCRSADGKLRAVITDFGLAGAAVDALGALAGTPTYMAPELWRGEPASKASDIYALGVILYELVTGRQPYAGLQEPSEDAAFTSPVPPSVYAKGVDRRWNAVILSCLDASPSTRPQDAAEVLARFQRKPFRKVSLVAVVLVSLLILAGFIPRVREPLLDMMRPAKVRLVVAPASSSEEMDATSRRILQNASGLIRPLRSGGAKVVVTPPEKVLNGNVITPKQAKSHFHATHILRVSVRREQNELEVRASVIDLGTQGSIREFSARYAPETAEDIPKALAGLVSATLRLQGDLASEPISPAAKRLYDQGMDLLRKNSYSYDQAFSLFTEAARLNPHSPLPLAGISEAKIQKFHGTKQQLYLDEAQEALSRAEALNPDSVAVHLASGLLYRTNGQYGKALDDYQRVLEIQPANVSALVRSAVIYNAQNMLDKAIENCQKAIQFEPDAPLLYQQLGSFYYYQGKYLLAAEQFQKAVERDHTLADSYASLGAVLNDLGRQAEAEQALLQSLKIRETALALSNLGLIRERQGRDAEAAGYYQKAAALEPGNYIDWLNLGDSERRLGRLAEARAAFRKVKELALVQLHQNPQTGHLRAVVAYAELRLGHNSAAEEEINEALHSAPGNSQVIYLAVLIYETLGQRNQTIDVLKGSTPEGIREIEHERDLAALQQDPRFLQLVAKAQEGGH